MKYKVGVIGNGFVGEAINFLFSSNSTVKIYDINKSKSINSLDETLESDFVFICLPTPMKANGSQDLSFINNFFENISNNDNPIYIIKSTVLPGITKKISNKYPNLKVVFSPEFLREKTAKKDIINQSRIILGSDKVEYLNKVEGLFLSRFKTLT